MPVTIPNFLYSDYFGATPGFDALVAKIPGYQFIDDGTVFVNRHLPTSGQIAHVGRRSEIAPARGRKRRHKKT